MQVWFVLEANNVDNDILMSRPFYSEEQAKARLFALYNGVVEDIGEDDIENAHYSGYAYSILTCGNDYFYGVVASTTIKEG